MSMTENELKALTDAEIRQAVGYWGGKLAAARQKAMVYYLGEPKLDLAPPEIDGRSSVVSPVVRNTIESMLPTLYTKFCGSDSIVEFTPEKPGQEKQAEQATDYINYLYFTRNNGALATYNWMKDALLQRNGIMKVWWDDRTEETREEYRGLSDVELAQLFDDPEIEVTEQKSRVDEEDLEQRKQALDKLRQQLAQAQDPNQQAAIANQVQNIIATPEKLVYDVVCKRSQKGGRICVENVPPEEFLICRNAKSIEEARFVGHRVQRTRSELKSQGYKNVDSIQGDDAAASMNMERIERYQFDDEMAWSTNGQGENMDESQQRIWVTECYVRCDWDGDGIAELRKVVRAGNQILSNDMVEISPFVSITPVPMPHKFWGLSIADLAETSQRTETMLLRAVLDNAYLETNGRYFAVENQVNLDDLMTSRPGGIVRIKAPGMVGRLDQGAGNTGLGLNMLEYMRVFNEDSTGWSRNSAGTDANALNSQVTATQAQIVTNKADMRVDLIARNFAEGFRDLFRLMLKLCAQYQQRDDIINLRGEWVPMSPREWRNGFVCKINVGIGTGNKDQQVMHLNALVNQQGHGLQIGSATPQNVYHAQLEMAKAMGFRNPEKFFTDPAKVPPKPNPQLSIEQAKLQATMQIEQQKAQLKAQTEQQGKAQEMQLERERMQMQAQVDAHRQEVESQQQAARMAMERELEQYRTQMQIQADLQREQFRRETELMIAKIKAEATLIGDQLRTGSMVTQQQDNAADTALNDSDDQ